MNRSSITSVFTIVTSIASILGPIFIFLTDNIIHIIALGLWALSLFLLLISLIYEITKMVKEQETTDYNIDSVFITFETIDKTRSRYQIFKNIQSKEQTSSCYLQRFNWSGTKAPILSSNIEKIEKQISQFQQNTNYFVKLYYKRPLTFNESTTVHFCTEVDDSDGSASPHVQFPVEKPIRILIFRIILWNKPNNYDKKAVVKTKPINTRHYTTFDRTDDIPFDDKAKTYYLQIKNPKVGYYYRIEWEKDNNVTPN